MFDLATADRIQQDWLLPFELTDLTPELPEPTPAVVTDDGAVHEPWAAPGMAEAEAGAGPARVGRRFDYAVAVRVPGREAVLASSTAGARAAREVLRSGVPDRACWLLRGEALPQGCAWRVLRGPEEPVPRTRLGLPLALLCDLGMVLTRFDRGLFGTHYRALFGRPAPPAGLDALERHRPAFERGELPVEEFWSRVQGPLGLAAPDFTLFAHAWGSILTPRKSTLALVQQAAVLEGVALVVVSNTDPLVLRHCREALGLSPLLERVSASFQEDVHPKGRDASLWWRGREIATRQLGHVPATVVAVDDVRDYLEQALAEGAADHAIHYRSYAQFRYELGRAGLYLPLRRTAASA